MIKGSRKVSKRTLLDKSFSFSEIKNELYPEKLSADEVSDPMFD